ncbi:MAG: hydrogenase nickel incorporation protein HypB, partial [Ignavibacteria bacterium]
MPIITIERKVLEKNDVIANQNRNKFKSKNLFVMNFVSSPGSGKTSLVEKTIELSRGKFKIGVIEGDVQTNLDAERVNKFNVPVVQIVTNGGCHLEANLIRDAYKNLENEEFEVLIIENVGNLVCPSNYDLGEDIKVVILSTTEGDDKPLKYPAMFRNAS